jgi:hypothetical protein
MIYIAHPYWDSEQSVRDCRYAATQLACQNLARRGHVPIASILFGAAIDPRETFSAEYWHAFSLQLLAKNAEAVLILPFQGWINSKGLARELALARCLNLPIWAPFEFNLPVPEIAADAWSDFRSFEVLLEHFKALEY